MKRVFGILALIIGSAIVLWVGYNLFIERQPEFKQDLLPLGTGAFMIYFGVMWIRGKTVR